MRGVRICYPFAIRWGLGLVLSRGSTPGENLQFYARLALDKSVRGERGAGDCLGYAAIALVRGVRDEAGAHGSGALTRMHRVEGFA